MASKSTSSKTSAPTGSSAANRAQIIARQTTGMTQGSTTPVATKATAAIASGASTVKPTTNLEFGSSLAKSLESAKSGTWNIANAQKSGAVLPSGGGSSGLNFNLGATSPESPGLTFGSDLLKAINESAGKASPFNIADAQKSQSVQKQISALNSIGSGSRLNFDYNPSATGASTMMKSTITPTPAPASTASKTGVAIPASTPTSMGTAKNFTQYYNQNKSSGKSIDQLKDEWNKQNGTIENPKAEEPPVIPEPKPEEPIIPEDIQVPNTVDGIQRAIMEAIQPSAEENSLQAQLDKETEALSQGLVEVEDRPVALPFITGMSSSLEKRSAIRTTPLQNRINQLQNARLGKLQALQTQLGFKNDELTRAFQKSSSDMSNKITLATKGLRYNDKNDTFYKDPTLASAASDPVEVAKLEQGLRKEYTDSAKTYTVVRDYYARMLKANEDPSAAGDLAMIFSYMKVLDPTSVVRESEFANAANASSVPDAIRNMWNKALTGERISANRQDFINQAGNIFNASNQQHQQDVKTYTSIANSAGVNPDNVVIDIGLAPEIASLQGKGASGPQDFNTDLTAGGGSYPTATYQDVASKVQSAINDIKAGYSKKQIMDYYHLTDAQYLQLTQTL